MRQIIPLATTSHFSCANGGGETRSTSTEIRIGRNGNLPVRDNEMAEDSGSCVGGAQFGQVIPTHESVMSLLRIKGRRETELADDLEEWTAANGKDRARCRRNVVAAVRLFRDASEKYDVAWTVYAQRLRYAAGVV